MDELNKASFRPKFTSEYSMGELDFLRYNEWLKLTEHWSAMINSTAEPTLEMIQNFFACLVNLYDSWRPIIAVPNVAEDIDNSIIKAKNLKRIWENSLELGLPFNRKKRNDLVDLLGSIKTRLYQIKQVIGLGIVVKRNLSTTEKIKLGIHGDRNFDYLPEA
jgi:hypothetical protein